MRTSLWLLVCVIVGCGGATQAERGPAPRAGKEAGSKIRLGRGLDLVVLGSGGPRSAGRAASSYLIALDGTPRMLVDVGSGALTRLGETALPIHALDICLLTHLHIDHVSDLPSFVKSRNLSTRSDLRFRIFGPSARGEYPSTSAFVERLFGDEGAYAYLRGFRNKLDLDVTDVSADLGNEPRELFNEGDVIVSAVAVEHGDTPALAYRIERQGRSVVFSGDLASKHGGIEKLAQGATVLVYGAAVLDPPGSPESLYALHTPPHRIGEIAARAGVKRLILSHVPPGTEEHASDILASVRETYTGDVRFAADGMRVALNEPTQH